MTASSAGEFFPVGSGGSRIVFAPVHPALEDGPDRLHVFDRNTAALFSRIPEGSVVLEPGEGSKVWSGVEEILRAAFGRGLARDSVFIGVGGGMVCDTAAFAASVFMRGARLELVPTSLLAMVDAAFGGKTAINFEGYKNMVGTFFPAEKITVSPAFLPLLPEREFLSGLAEVIKAAMLGDGDLFRRIRDRGADLLSSESMSGAVPMLELVRRSLLVKARFVGEDPKEKGIRAHLNLGHTFAHGLESATGFRRFTHGEAVAWGILRALDAGLALGVTDPGYAEDCRGLIGSYPYPGRVSGANPADILAAMERDKKKTAGRVRFVLQRGLGDTFTMPLEPDLVRDVLERGLA